MINPKNVKILIIICIIIIVVCIAVLLVGLIVMRNVVLKNKNNSINNEITNDVVNDTLYIPTIQENTTDDITRAVIRRVQTMINDDDDEMEISITNLGNGVRNGFNNITGGLIGGLINIVSRNRGVHDLDKYEDDTIPRRQRINNIVNDNVIKVDKENVHDPVVIKNNNNIYNKIKNNVSFNGETYTKEIISKTT